MKIIRNRIIAICFTIVILLSFSISTLAEGNYAFLKAVKECHDHIRENGYYYSRGVELPLDREGNKRVDCSSFLSWTLYDYTDGDFSESHDSAWFLKLAEDLRHGRDTAMPEVTSDWRVITNLDHLVPGDIMCYKKHVQIYAGKNNDGKHLVYSAGCDATIQDEISVITDAYFNSTRYGIRIP